MKEVTAQLTHAEVSQGFEHGVTWLIETHSFHRMLLISVSQFHWRSSCTIIACTPLHSSMSIFVAIRHTTFDWKAYLDYNLSKWVFVLLYSVQSMNVYTTA